MVNRAAQGRLLLLDDGVFGHCVVDDQGREVMSDQAPRAGASIAFAREVVRRWNDIEELRHEPGCPARNAKGPCNCGVATLPRPWSA